MDTLSFGQLRTQATAMLERVAGNPDFDLYVVGSLLAAVVALSLLTAWRGRARRIIPPATPSTESGFRRWLTPLGMPSIPAVPGAGARAPRASGSNKSIRVTTPVCKVPARSLRAHNANPLEIARRTGLARDAVVMMMANADPKAHAARTTAPKVAPQPKAQPAAERAMTAPGAYTAGARAKPASDGRTLGTQFNARLS